MTLYHAKIFQKGLQEKIIGDKLWIINDLNRTDYIDYYWIIKTLDDIKKDNIYLKRLSRLIEKNSLNKQ